MNHEVTTVDTRGAIPILVYNNGKYAKTVEFYQTVLIPNKN